MNSVDLNVRLKDHYSIYEIFIMSRETIVQEIMNEIQDKCSNGDYIKDLLYYGDINIDTHWIGEGEIGNGRSFLIRAAHNDKKDIVKILLEAGANPNVQDTMGCTALHYSGSVDVLQLLLDHHLTDPNLSTGYGTSPLTAFVKSGRLRLVQVILDHPLTNPNTQTGEGNTALMYAAMLGNIKTIKAILDHPLTDPNIQTNMQETALMWGVEGGHLGVVQAILKHPHTNPDIKNIRGNTALHFAFRKNYITIVEELLNHPSFKRQDI